MTDRNTKRVGMTEVKNLEENMRLLIAIQDCDTHIMDIQAKKDAGPQRMERLKKDLEALERTLDEGQQRFKACEQESRATEQEVENLENRLKKAEVKLSSINSNKEYRAALKELDELKRQKALLEDRLIEYMEEMEALRGECEMGQQRVREGTRQFEEDRDRVLKEQAALEEALGRFQTQREQFTKDIDGTLLSRYDSLRGKKGGVAVTPVIKGVCQACHLGIPPQKFNELIRGDQLMRCPNCYRIIYWGEDRRFQENGATPEPGRPLGQDGGAARGRVEDDKSGMSEQDR